MQVLPETASELASWGSVDSALYPPDRLTDPAVNIEYGTAYLRYLVEHYHEMEPAIAAYNAGMGNVDKAIAKAGDPRSTGDYSAFIQALPKPEETDCCAGCVGAE